MSFEIKDMDHAIEYVKSMIGSDFNRALNLAEAILDSPGDYSGRQAAMAAIQLSAHRYKIGVAAQAWKRQSVKTQRDQDRLTKDALQVSYDAIKDLVDALKKISTLDFELANATRPRGMVPDDGDE